MTFREIWRSGYVTRYHARPEVKAETLAEHHCRVAQILCELYHPRIPPKELLHAALHHDVAELVVGDLPYPFKAAQPAIAEAHAAEEARQMARIMRSVDGRVMQAEGDVLKLADRIAAYLYAAPQDPANPEWMDELKAIVKEAGRMGYGHAIWRILEATSPAIDPQPLEWPAEPASALPEGLGDVSATHAAETATPTPAARVCGGCRWWFSEAGDGCGLGLTYKTRGDCQGWQPRSDLASLAARDSTAWQGQDGGVE